MFQKARHFIIRRGPVRPVKRSTEAPKVDALNTTPLRAVMLAKMPSQLLAYLATGTGLSFRLVVGGKEEKGKRKRKKGIKRNKE